MNLPAIRKPASDTLVNTYGDASATSYGPRIDNGREVRPPYGDERPTYWSAYYRDEIGHWNWLADCVSEKVARITAETFHKAIAEERKERQS